MPTNNARPTSRKPTSRAPTGGPTTQLGAAQMPDIPRLPPPEEREDPPKPEGPFPRQSPEKFVERPQNYPEKNKRLRELKDRRTALQDEVERQMRTGSGRVEDRVSKEVRNELSSVREKIPAMKEIVPQNPGTVAISTRTGEAYNRDNELQMQVSRGVIDAFYFTPAGAEKKPAIAPGDSPGSPVEMPEQTRTDSLLMYGEKPLAEVREQVSGAPFITGVFEPSLQEVQSIRDTGKLPERATQEGGTLFSGISGSTGTLIGAGAVGVTVLILASR